MKWGRALGLSLSVAATAAAAEPGLAPPAWTLGQRWTVMVAAASRRLEEAPDGSTRYLSQPSQAVPWDLEVTRKREVEGFPADEYLVLASRRAPPRQTLRLEFVARRGERGPQALALVAVTTASGVVRDFRKEDHRPGPGLLRGTALPVVFPYLERGAPRRRRFPRVRYHGGIPFAEDVVQRMSTGEGARALAADLGVAVEEGEPAWAIEVHHPLRDVRAHLVWVEGEPWPRASRLGVLTARLVR